MTEQNSVSAETSAPRRRMPPAFAALESVDFRWMLGSMLAFFLATQGDFLIHSLLSWDLTHSELNLAYINLVIALPMMFGSFIAGALSDRMERRRLLLISQGIVMVNELIVLSLYHFGKLTYPYLLFSSFVLGVMFPFISPTRVAMIRGLVGRERLGNAMALQVATQNVARVLGPSIVGMLIPIVAIQGSYLFSLMLQLLSTWALVKLPTSFPDNKSGRSLWKDVTYSFTYIGKHRPILLTVIFGIFPLLLTLPVYSMLVVFSDEVWHVGERGLGFLMAMLGLGGIVGSMTVARMGDNQHRGLWMVGGAVVFSVLLAGFSLSPSFLLALALLFAANVFSNICITQNNTIIQLLSHEEVRGRMSSLTMLSLGLTPLGVLPIATASETYGVDWTIFCASLILLAVVLAMVMLSPTLRGMDRILADKRRDDMADSTAS